MSWHIHKWGKWAEKSRGDTQRLKKYTLDDWYRVAGWIKMERVCERCGHLQVNEIRTP